ncbi:hypothetical protein THAOC_32873 [Thalassiosira oceanica]|uniref:Uncharacterized protein n=1 Tax=Thalassiosira oceanica TaxID=159749 RepID=K0R885_THAOC|nr:hypothetical protein THAOC_32873 [Thalassiosira oceanica]|eukprot:EJK48339.1 hypothetical protein THAOC_32873 [Thalassiosira oceanica]
MAESSTSVQIFELPVNANTLLSEILLMDSIYSGRIPKNEIFTVKFEKLAIDPNASTFVAFDEGDRGAFKKPRTLRETGTVAKGKEAQRKKTLTLEWNNSLGRLSASKIFCCEIKVLNMSSGGRVEEREFE